MDLDEIKNELRDRLRNEDVSEAVPAHDAFEVEVVPNGENYVFVLDRAANAVRVLDTTRGRDVVGTLNIDMNPHVGKAIACYTELYRQALRGVLDVWFLGYMDPVTLKPPEERC